MPHQKNHDIRGADQQDIDGIDDSDDSDDDDDNEDDSEDDNGDDRNEAAGSPLRPRFAVNLAPKEFASRGAQAAVTPAASTSSPSYKSLDGSSTSSPSRPDRCDKLPSITKSRHRLARSVIKEGALPTRPASSHSLGLPGASKDALPRGTVSDDMYSTIDDIDASRLRQRLPTTRTQDSRHSANGFEPQPIEMDLLELSFKYDHLTSLNSRTPTNALPNSTGKSCTLDSEKPKANSQRRNDPMP
jgi:hypothetical protein